MEKTKKIIVRVGVCLAVIMVSVMAFALFWYAKWADDFSRLKKEQYDTVFFSMYPTDYYEEGDYTHFRGMQIVKTDYVIPDSRIMRLYMDVAVRSGNIITTAYLGIDPEKVDTQDIFQLTQENPGTLFEIVLAYPQMDYWLAMDEEQAAKVMDRYRDFAGMVLGLSNVQVYYFCNAEWLLCNPGNYVDTFQTNTEVSELLMCNSDNEHKYILNVENFHERFNQAEKLIKQYREARPTFVDASEWEMVCLGDSIFGIYNGSLSIPGVVQGFMNAAIYNCGYGGKGAALHGDTNVPLPAVVDAIISGNTELLPEGSQVHTGVEQYLNADHSGKRTLFVINHGLNDYFSGAPVQGMDPVDISGYSGAIRTAVEAIKKAYPEAEIVLQTPNFTIAFENGTLVRSEVGGTLEEYAEALLMLAQELDVHVLDNYHELPITEKNYYWYLADECHPNEQGRFLMGVRLCELLEEIIQE